ncbi:MAG TPA: hypothetical protein VMN39_11455, partial [Longimicrobiaceae bacterium]|nr:hypothetical protein [Longimicrobiaceae bacterium]
GGRFSWAYRAANALHVRTTPGVIARELLFSRGDCYESEELRESERLLRAFGFLADAEITEDRQADGTVHVRVETRDEWSTRVQPRLETDGRIQFRGIELVEDNLVGTGRHLSLFYDREDDQRIYGAGYSTPHFLRTRTDMALRVARTDVGEIVQQSITYPFVGEAGRFGFRQQIDRSDRYFEILIPNGNVPGRVWVPLRREHAEVGAAIRRGEERYRYSIFGAAIAAERVTYPAEPIFADSTGRPTVPTAVFRPPWDPMSSVRVVGLVGRRDVEYVRRRGLDTVDGVEDVQLGFEGEISLGAAVPGISVDEDFAFAARAGWAGEPAPEITWGITAGFEGRRMMGRLDGPAVRDVLAEANAWAYLRPWPERRHTVVGSIAAAGGWDTRVPFQLSLGARTGLRGYPRHLDPGGRRVVASLEHRAYLGWPAPSLFDLGSVAFLDVGKIWPGDVPFGIESPVRGAAGVGIRVGFPPGSRQTFRADVGLPIQSEVGSRGVVVSVGVRQVIGRRVRLPDSQLRRSANYGLSVSDFTSSY